jgi:hypothetical protein
VSEEICKRYRVEAGKMWECLNKETTGECITVGVLLVGINEGNING